MVVAASATADGWRRRHESVLVASTGLLTVAAAHAAVPATISQRLKTREAIVAKLARDRASQLTTMQDIAGCRAVVADIGGAMAVIGALEDVSADVFEVVRSVDHLDAPKPSGYRAHHLILKERELGLLVEVQIRTELQHRWADLVEHVGDRSGQRLKHGEGSERLLELLRGIADAFAALDAAAPGGSSLRSSGAHDG